MLWIHVHHEEAYAMPGQSLIMFSARQYTHVAVLKLWGESFLWVSLQQEPYYLGTIYWGH